jgi:hypothetical protein
MHLQNFGGGNNYQIEQIKFTDGTTSSPYGMQWNTGKRATTTPFSHSASLHTGYLLN